MPGREGDSTIGNNRITRRGLLGTGISLTMGSFAGCIIGSEQSTENNYLTEVGNTVEVKDDTPTATTKNYTEIERKALNHAEKLGISKKNIEEFIEDERINQDFKKEQLKIWIQAPKEVRYGDVIVNYPMFILDHGGLYLNDWNQNGQPHLLPDGSPGPDFNNPYDPNPDNDAFMPGFYNRSGTTHDILTGEYLGFQPEKGDKVGKLGDRNGHGSIADYLEEDVEPEDLTGHMISVLWWDWMEDGETPRKLAPEAQNTLRDFFKNAPVQNPDGTEGVDLHFIEGEPIPYKKEMGSEINNIFRENVPDPLKGPVNYLAIVEDMWAAGVPIKASPSDGAMIVSSPDIQPSSQSNLVMHEIYGHAIAGLTHSDAGEGTIMVGRGKRSLRFKKGNWELVLEAMDVQNREFYSTWAGS